MKRIDKTSLLLICASVSVATLITSNIITNKQFNLPWGWAITCGTLCVPFSYIADDVLAEIFGYKVARRVILTAFAMNALAVLYFELALAIPGNLSFTAQEAFQTVLGAAARTTLASFVAYLMGSIANARVMSAMHSRDGKSRLAARCILSTVVGEFLDMGIFAVLAFAGTLPWAAIGQIVISNACVKVAIEAVFYPVMTRRVIGWARNLPEK